MQLKMTSVHINQSGSQTTTTPTTINGNLSQSHTSPIKFDDEERVRQRMEEFRRHHAETAEIHNRTQPKVDDQIHEDTLRYLKTGQVNGTKAKGQKPRAPKRQRTTASNNTSATQGNITPTLNGANNNLNQTQVHQTPPRPTGINNNIQNRPVSLMPQQQAQNGVATHSQQRYIVQQTTSQPHVATMQPGMQPIQHMPSYSPHMQQSVQIQQQSNQMHQSHSYNDSYHQNQYQSQPSYSLKQEIQPMPHGNSLMQNIDQGHHYIHQQNNNFAQRNHPSFYQTLPVMNTNVDHHNTTLPNDLDLNIQAGLECDIDSLIKHEMSVEGQLDFNPDLLVKLDNHYQPNYQ